MSAQTILEDGKISANYFAATAPDLTVSTLTLSTINTYPFKSQWLGYGSVSTTRGVDGEQYANVDVGAGAPALFSLIMSPTQPIDLAPRVYASSISSSVVTIKASGDAVDATYNWVAYPLFTPAAPAPSTITA